MKAIGLTLCSFLLPLALSAATNSGSLDPLSGRTPFVVVGDSLSAGVQNFSLLESQQPNGYASLIANQAKLPLTLPLVTFPGAPNVLQVVSLTPVVDIEPVSSSQTPARDNPGTQPTNIAVPGLTVDSALSLQPSLTPTTPEQAWATLVLGFPSLLEGQAPTEIELAKSLKPNLTIEWLGNNDALVPALAGQLNTLTPVSQFAKDYKKILDSLSQTGSRIVTATVPDVTEVAFFTSARTIAAQLHLPLATVTAALKIGPNDYVRPSAQVYIDQIFTGAPDAPKGLPVNCPAPLPDLGASTLPCVLTAADALKIKLTVDAYNLIIAAESFLHGAVLVDIHGLVDRIYHQGYQVGNQELSTNFFGGLFSLDGIHPTNTGYAVIANEFIRTMNSGLRMNIPPVDVATIHATDPLAEYATPLTIQPVKH